ncbi:MAG TPA: RraA family protein, partial [Verrucomicrobiae bacterium]|nr:RraA family protein [Verrucomicrobiae bacterium]
PEMKPTLTGEQLESLRRLGTCAVSNAIEQFDVRLRNEGFADAKVRCMFPRLPAVAGYAVTAKIRCSGPPLEGHAILERTDWWDSISRMPAPRIFVIEDVDDRPGRGSLLGEVHAHILLGLQCAAAVTNGAVRDLPAVEAAGMQFFANHPAVSHSYAHIVEVGGPVCVGGLVVNPGDLLLGDIHGVLSVPLEIAADIPAMASRLAARERKIISACAAGNLSLGVLRNLVQEKI